MRVPARAERGGGDRRALPHHPGLGGLLPDGGVQPRFHCAGHYLWRLTYKWARRQPPQQAEAWIIGRYFGKFNKSRHDRWVFGDRGSGAYLLRFSWTGIVRHHMVRGTASPDDPALAGYWADRRQRGQTPARRRHPAPAAGSTAGAHCAGNTCSPPTSHPKSPRATGTWWLQVTRKAIAASYLVHHGRPGPGGGDPTRLVHASCHRGLRARTGRQEPGTAALHARAACLSRVPR